MTLPATVLNTAALHASSTRFRAAGVRSIALTDGVSPAARSASRAAAISASVASASAWELCVAATTARARSCSPWCHSQRGLSGRNGMMRMQMTEKMPCNADGMRQAQDESSADVPSVTPAAMRPPTHRQRRARSPGTAGSARTDVVEVVEHAEPPRAPRVRERLGEVRGAGEPARGGPEPDADARDDEHGDVLRGRLEHDGDERERGGPEERGAAAERVGERAEERAGEAAADVDGRGGDADGVDGEVEVVRVGGQDVQAVPGGALG
jgi:hypothetical protein